MHRIARNLNLFLFFLVFQTPAFSQLEKNLGMMDEYDAILYAKPIVTALTNVSHAGTGFKTEIDKEVIITIALKGFAMYPTGSEGRFNPSGNGGLSGVSTATILGDKGSVFSGPLNQKYTYPNGYNASFLSHFFIFLSASYENTELYLKVFPQMNFADKSVLLTSIGVRANVNQFFFKRFPFDLTLGLSFNKFSVSTYIKSWNYGLSAQIGETYGKLSIYANMIYEINDGSVKYSIIGNPASANASIRSNREVWQGFKQSTAFLTTLGMSLKYDMFILSGEYLIAKNNVMVVGVSVIF
ncbi:MAG: DUF6588 family protein [Ignavibacteriaceae bacterium]